MQKEATLAEKGKFSSIDEIEEERKAEYFKYFIIQIGLFVLTIISFCAATYFFDWDEPDNKIYAVILLYSMSAFFGFLFYRHKQIKYKNFSKKLKNLFSEDMIDFVNRGKNASFEFFNHNRITPEELRRSALFRPFNNLYYDDMCIGSCNNAHFSIAEIALSHDNAYQTYVHIEDDMPIKQFCHFSGMVILYNLKDIKQTNTIIKAKAFELHFRQMIAIILGVLLVLVHIFLLWLLFFHFNWFMSVIFLVIIIQDVICFHRFKVLWEMDDDQLGSLKKTELDKKFNVFSERKFDSAIFVSPSFVEWLNGVQELFNVKKIRCSLYNDKLMLAIESKKNFFEVGSFNKSLIKSNAADEFYKQIEAIYTLTENLQKNTEIGKYLI